MKSVIQEVKEGRKVELMTTSQIVWYLVNRHRVYLLIMALILSNLLWLLFQTPIRSVLN